MISVLIVDDEPLVRLGITTSLTRHEGLISVIGQAENGRRALEFVSAHAADLDAVLTDIRMPVMDGIELTREIRQRFPHVKVIVLSSYNDFHYVKEALKQGASDYLLKYEVDERNILGHFEAIFGPLVRNEAMPPGEGSRTGEHLKQDSLRSLFTSPHHRVSEQDRRLLSERTSKAVIMVRVRRVESVLSGMYDGNAQRLETVVFNILTEYLKQKYTVEHFAASAGTFIFIIELGERDDYYRHAAEFLGLLLKKYLDICSDIGLSSPFVRLADAHAAYLQAQAACDACFFADSGSFGFVEHRDIRAPDETGAAARLEELELILKQGQHRRLEEWLHDLFLHFVRHNGSDAAQARQVYLEACRRLYEAALGQGAASAMVKQYADYRDKIGAIDSLYLMNAYLFRLLDLFPAGMPPGPHGLSEPIRNAVDYIGRNFHDPGISLESVADHLHFNAAYVSRLFKRETGKGFLEFLTGLRMERAKQMLANRGNESLQAIAEAVGYVNYSHFSKTFKRITGRSPSDYVP